MAVVLRPVMITLGASNFVGCRKIFKTFNITQQTVQLLKYECDTKLWCISAGCEVGDGSVWEHEGPAGADGAGPPTPRPDQVQT